MLSRAPINLTAFGKKQAEAKRGDEAERTIRARIPEAWVACLVPHQSDPQVRSSGPTRSGSSGPGKPKRFTPGRISHNGWSEVLKHVNTSSAGLFSSPSMV